MPKSVSNELMDETLKAIQGTLSEHSTVLFEIKERIGNLETQYASISRRVDRLDGRVGRIERRLELIDDPSVAE